ncbi:hypothetical protein C5Y96_19495 [Blastopirellula marina]|uniref:SRPBCC family protein n=1 Tax=Blastopirellula marina TaxID=124 RepID=A0A2S8F486_9BACT|nr:MULTISPECIES: SRPBCC family protein [Pirellulaceae]PQO26963.1 hypothetical protein C5Y96_19495 [Blastopirellula marina]RCS46552.1 hypothetical protein DTL36_19525 [Bremerella cremea]
MVCEFADRKVYEDLSPQSATVRKQAVQIEIEAPAPLAFDVIHDYQRRLEWDSLLSVAKVLPPDELPGVGVCTRCVGKWTSCWMVMDTRYVTFERGRVASVTLVNRSWLFASFHATIRHETLAPSRSRVIYIYSFACRPQTLAWAWEPIVDFLLNRETQRRLHSLRDYVQRV